MTKQEDLWMLCDDLDLKPILEFAVKYGFFIVVTLLADEEYSEFLKNLLLHFLLYLISGMNPLILECSASGHC